MKRRILVLGAANFVGARTVAALQASYWAVPIAFGKSTAAVSRDDLSAVDGIVNCTMGSAKAIRNGATALFKAAAGLDKPVRIIHLSSMTIYGSSDREVSESTPPLADLGAYGDAHIEAECLANQYPDSVILRCGCEYGPDCTQWSERIAGLLMAHRLGDLGAAGDGICNLLFIDDLAAAILESLQRSIVGGQTFNLAMRGPPTWNEYFIRFAISLGAVPVRRITARRLNFETKVLAPPLKILEIIAQRWNSTTFGIAPPITSSLINLCKQEITLNVAKAEQLLETSWTPLDEGLRRAASAFLAIRFKARR